MKKFITRQLNKFFDTAVVKTTSVFVCAVLAVLSMTCVGFATWIVVNPGVKQTVNASPFEVYTVTDSQNYINLSDAKGFSYYYTGFTDGSGNLVPTGDVSFTVGFKSGNAQGFLEATKGMNLQFTLYFTSIQTDASAADVIPDAECTIGTTTVACTKFTQGGEYCLRASVRSDEVVDKNSAESTFEVTFRLANNTYAEFYKYLQNNGTFMIEARVSKIYA